ncbi:hypothetical protein ACFYUV_20380 [Nonomuraea sp. NPDC003560]|uniref:hypothetical protein n=1 Tax=Nonomuraea sp. NPDC003560 TaxID=3364341 RepID=UPI0036C1300D
MNTHLLIAILALVAFPGCTLREPTAQARTPSQIAARVRAARWWEFPLWPLCVGLAPLGVAGWWALRSAVFNLSAVAAWFLAKVATAFSADGRRYRLVRTDGLRAVSS